MQVYTERKTLEYFSVDPLLLTVTYSFCFSIGTAKLDECKVSVETVRRFRLKQYGIDEMSEEYPLFGDSFILLYIILSSITQRPTSLNFIVNSFSRIYIFYDT